MSEATRLKKIYQSFNGGINTRYSPILIKENEFAILENARVNDRGLLEKFKGYIKDGSPFPDNPDSFIRMLLNLKIGTTVDLLLMAAQDDSNTNSQYKVDLKQTTGDGTYSYIGLTSPGTASFTNGSTAVTGIGTNWLSQLKAGDKIKRTSDPDTDYVEIFAVPSDTSITLVSVYPGTTGVSVPFIGRIILHKDFVPRGIIFDDKAVITNGSEIPFTYDSATIALLTDPDAPRARYIEAHKNRVFMASSAGFPSGIFWSFVNDVTTWDAASEEDIFPQDGGNIIAIKSFGDSLVVFKNNGGIYQVAGSFDQDEIGEPNFIRKVDSFENIGIIAERSPVVHNGYLWFYAQTGIYRIDQRMNVEKYTYNVDSIISQINFSLGPSQAKTYTFDGQTEWNTGSFNGMRATTDGTVQNYFDQFTISDASKNDGLCSVFTDTAGNLHVAYVDLGTFMLKYKMYAVDNTVTSETVLTEVLPILNDLSICVDPLTGNVGISYITAIDPRSNGQLKFVQRDFGTGLWGTATQVFTPAAIFASCSLQYRLADSFPRIGSITTSGSSDFNYHKFDGAVWSTVNIAINRGDPSTRCCLTLTSTDAPGFLAYDERNFVLECRTAASDIAAFTLLDSVSSVADNLSGRPQLNVSSTGDFISAYFDGNTIKKRNHTTATTTTLDGTTGRLIGYTDTQQTIGVTTADRDYWYQSDSNGVEKFYFENSSNIVNGMPTISTSGNYVGSRGFSTNGTLWGTAAFGVNVNEIIVRRLAFRAIWTGPEKTDASFTSWGIYAVTGQLENSGTILQEVALASSSPATVFNPIVPGTLISANNTLSFIKNRLTFVLGAFAAPVIASIVDNYTGSGVDAKQIVGISFNNELYHAMSDTGVTANNHCLVVDREEMFVEPFWPVSSFERFKLKLYGGKSTNGDLIILNQGFNYDGSAYTLDAQGKEDFLDSIELEKTGYKIYVLYEVKALGSFTFSYRLDSFMVNGGTDWTDQDIDQTQSGIAEVKIGKKFRSIQCRVQNDSLDNQMGVIGYIITYDNLNIR